MSDILLLFLIIVLGLALGGLKIGGLSLGSSGVLLLAIVFGHFGFELPSLVRELGLVIFVTAIGYIAGPVFFRSFKAHASAYLALGAITIAVGAAVTVLCILIFELPADLAVGMMAGALTSTPGLAAAVEASGSATASVGYGVAYPFGVVGVVLFVQLAPKLLGVDVAAEVARITLPQPPQQTAASYRQIDAYGLLAFALAALLGLLLGKISLPLPGGAHFALGNSGGPLLSGLLLGHFGHLGSVSLTVKKQVLNPLRELGLIFFLIGAGLQAGNGFVEVLRQYGLLLFILGALITTLPMLVAYLLGRRLFKLELFNALGSLCGGMTSTPALGTLISVTNSDAVTTAYATTYPVALICIVLASQFIVLLL